MLIHAMSNRFIETCHHFGQGLQRHAFKYGSANVESGPNCIGRKM